MTGTLILKLTVALNTCELNSLKTFTYEIIFPPQKLNSLLSNVETSAASPCR